MFFLSSGDSYRIPTQISYIPTRLTRLLPDWMSGPWILSLVPCIYSMLEKRVCAAVSRDDPVNLPVPCTLKFATLSLCFRADFAHFPTELHMFPLLHSDVFLLHVRKNKTSDTLKKCIYPKEPSACIPSIKSLIPRKECDASTSVTILALCMI